jgi:hypothetical protein
VLRSNAQYSLKHTRSRLKLTRRKELITLHKQVLRGVLALPVLGPQLTRERNRQNKYQQT